jgi:hypothetical protein
MPLRIGGHVIDDPMPLWCRYARDYPRTIRGYDLGDPGDPAALTEAEAWRSRIINSRLTRREQDQVVKRAAAARGRASQPAPTWPAPIPPHRMACSPAPQDCTGPLPGQSGSAGYQ